jgi:transcriptional regulator with XRE-family HTH domain
LTQRELAALLGVSERAIRAREAGPSYPRAARLRDLIALYVERRAFGAGHEAGEAEALWATGEAEALWATVRAKAPQRIGPFDTIWFASLPGAGGGAVPAAPRHDCGEAPAVAV